MKEQDVKAANNLRTIWERRKEETGMNQTDFASVVGMSQSNFAIYLNKHQPISLKVLLKLCEALQCNASDIREELKDGYFLNNNTDNIGTN